MKSSTRSLIKILASGIFFARGLAFFSGTFTTFWPALGICILLLVIQYGSWALMRKGDLISYSLSFLPASALFLSFVRLFGQNLPLYHSWSSWLCLALFLLLPLYTRSKGYPAHRESTDVWIGALIYVIIFAALWGAISVTPAYSMAL